MVATTINSSSILQQLLRQTVRLEGHHALLGRGQLQPLLIAGDHQSESARQGNMEGTCSRVPAPAGTLAAIT